MPNNLNVIFTVLNVVSSMVATTASILMLIASRTQVRISKNKSERHYAPYLFVKYILFCKSKWIRFSDGVETPDYIPSKNYSELDMEKKKYVDNCGKPENSQKVYFDQLDGEIILVANLSNKMPTLLVEHGSTEIKLTNYGEAAITKLTINCIEIYMLNGEKHKLKGGINNSYTNIIPSGGSIVILLDEVVNDLAHSTCRISKEKYDQLTDCDILSQSVETLQYYNDIVANITLENIYCEKTSYEIAIEKKERYMKRRIELVHTK